MKAKDHSGETHGRLTLIKPLRSVRWEWIYECRCACGKKTEVYYNNIRRGNTLSCGCLHSERTSATSSTHRMSKTRIYGSWQKLISRCEYEDDRNYKNYGGRWISVCKRWRNSFENFLKDIGPRPSRRHSLDRINNDGNYEPSNVRWATQLQQSRNRRSVRLATIGGVTKTVPEWCEFYGTNHRNVRMRLKGGYSMKEAVSIKRLKPGPKAGSP